MTDAVAPLHSNDEPGPLFSISQAARRLAEPGESVDEVARQLRGFAQRRLMQVRDKKGSGRTAYNLFAWSDLVVGKILRTLTMMGMADNEALQAASDGCYTWTQHNPVPAKPHFYHPITHAIHGFAKRGKAREYWEFQMEMFINDQTGQREFVAVPFNPMKQRFEYDPEGGFAPVGTILIPIYRSLPAILADHSGQN